MTQDDNTGKINKLLERIAYDVIDFFEEFNRPAKASTILKHHKNSIQRVGLLWQDVEIKLKEKGLVRIRRHEETNNKWFFPPLPECTDEVLSEMITLMDNR